ncbi:MAG: hypothetical protein ACO1O1_02830 [Adhaeribacter sp.]
MDKTELARLKIEKRKLDIELEKLSIEKSKLIWSSLIGTIPLLAVIFTIYYGIWTQRQQEKIQFQLKAAEIMFNARDAYEIKSRAEILNLIFPDKLPANFSHTYYPDSMGLYSQLSIEARIELLKMMAGKAKSKNEIVENWRKLFPDDRWAEQLLVKED